MNQVDVMDQMVAEEALPAIKRFFQKPDEDSKTGASLMIKAEMGLKLTGIAARRKSADTNALAVELKVRTAAGQSGKDLDPLLQKIGGRIIDASGEAVEESRGSLASAQSTPSSGNGGASVAKATPAI